jgi:hypothetical protein
VPSLCLLEDQHLLLPCLVVLLLLLLVVNLLKSAESVISAESLVTWRLSARNLTLRFLDASFS